MAYWIGNYMLAFLISVLLAGLIIPNIIHIAFSRNLFDSQDERKIHRGVVPRLGGISFLPSIIFSFALLAGSNLELGIEEMADQLAATIVPIFFMICSIMLMYLVGIADDLIGVRYRVKFVFQIISGILIVCSGLSIYNLYGFLGIYEWPAPIGWAAAIFLVVFVVNSINLIDGIDGLASGLSAIALIFYSYIFFISEQYVYAFIAGATLGTLVPFFIFNVFGNPETETKIFMGDTGALTIGVILSFLSLAVFNIPTSELTELRDSDLFILALSPLIIPCFDVVRVFIHRVRNHRNPFLPDKCHIHHKLLAVGIPQRKALISILLVDAAFVVADMILSSVVEPTLLFIANILLWTLLNIFLTKRIRICEKRSGKTLYK